MAILFALDAALMIGAVVGLFAWGWRDGWGQYAVESTGIEAIRKAFFDTNWAPIFALLLSARIAAHFALRPDRDILRLSILFWVAFIFTSLIQYVAAWFVIWSPP